MKFVNQIDLEVANIMNKIVDENAAGAGGATAA